MRIEVTEESLRAAVDERVFARAAMLAGRVTGLAADGPLVGATVDGARVSVRIRPGLDARCGCPAPAPCPHAVAAVLAWVRAGAGPAEPAGQAGPGPAAGLRAELDVILGGMAREAADCDPDDGWYPDTGDLEDLLDQVEDLADGAPAAAAGLAGHAAARISEVLAAGNCLTGDLADALARARELAGDLGHLA